MTDEQIEAVWNAVDASDLDVHDRKLAMKLRCRFARAIEQASRREALKEAAKVCDDRALNFRDTLRIITCELCAKDIRALSGSTET